MARHAYRNMDEAPKDGTPIIAVVNGVEMGVMWEDQPVLGPAWFYFDEGDDGPLERVRGDISGWRLMFTARPAPTEGDAP